MLLIVFIVLLLLTQFRYKEGMENKEDTVMVISHYNEDLSYLNEKPFSNYKQIVYTKGVNDPKCAQCAEFIKLDNVGVCIHTYLKYIIDNYENLPKIVIFLAASCMDNHKKDKTLKTIKNVEETKDSVFLVTTYQQPVSKSLQDFVLDFYPVANEKNRSLNTDFTMSKSEIRPFGKWYEKHFPDIDIYAVNYQTLFAVSREHILNRSKESYKELIKLVDKHKNEESAHFFERAMLAIFHPVPHSCLYPY
jgi:hypothetical protein